MSKTGEMAPTDSKKAEALKNELEKLIKESYDTNFGKKDDKKDISEDDFYHAIYEIIEKLNDKKGAMQLKLPDRKKLREEYDAQLRRGQKMSKDDFDKIVKKIITFDSFSVGKGALDVMAFMFGVPISALLAKRFIPGGASVSEDILIPAVTSLTVLVLAKINKL